MLEDQIDAGVAPGFVLAVDDRTKEGDLAHLRLQEMHQPQGDYGFPTRAFRTSDIKRMGHKEVLRDEGLPVSYTHLEALSRGAQEVCLVEREPKVVQCLNQNVEALDVSDRCRVAESDVLRFLRGRAYQPYDVIFADPPYGENRLVPTLKAIMTGGWLAPDGYLLAEIEGLLRLSLIHILKASWSASVLV